MQSTSPLVIDGEFTISGHFHKQVVSFSSTHGVVSTLPSSLLTLECRHVMEACTALLLLRLMENSLSQNILMSRSFKFSLQSRSIITRNCNLLSQEMSMQSPLTTTMAITELQLGRQPSNTLTSIQFKGPEVCEPSSQCEQVKLFTIIFEKVQFYYKNQVSFTHSASKCLHDGANMNIITDRYSKCIINNTGHILIVMNIISDNL